MSDTILSVVEIAHDDEGKPVVHIDAWQALQSPLMQSVEAETLAVYTATGAVSFAVAESVQADIKARIDGGSSSPVLKSHLDDLGITAAVEAWASD
tara:strand:+ start:111 stop:398 length:288 start_codon:yes stop_codon:yes gene_type:complete